MSAQANRSPSTAATRALTTLYRSSALLFAFVSALALYAGWQLVPLSLYITPERGVGYALGIVGGSFMLLLLVYPLRKRVRWLGFIGSVKAWFRIHMVLGIVGPILVLYHANFQLGATNSNVALICMLLVAGSGLVGRYFYTKIHEGLYGRENNLTELQARAQELRQMALDLPMLSGLLDRLDKQEQHILRQVARHFLLIRPLYAAALSYTARWRLLHYVRGATRNAEHNARPRLLAIARKYVRTRIGATRRVSEYQAYVSLFSWWHILHLPLFFLLLIAGTVHVIAVHVY